MKQNIASLFDSSLVRECTDKHVFNLDIIRAIICNLAQAVVRIIANHHVTLSKQTKISLQTNLGPVS